MARQKEKLLKITWGNLSITAFRELDLTDNHPYHRYEANQGSKTYFKHSRNKGYYNYKVSMCGDKRFETFIHMQQAAKDYMNGSDSRIKDMATWDTMTIWTKDKGYLCKFKRKKTGAKTL